MGTDLSDGVGECCCVGVPLVNGQKENLKEGFGNHGEAKDEELRQYAPPLIVKVVEGLQLNKCFAQEVVCHYIGNCQDEVRADEYLGDGFPSIILISDHYRNQSNH